MKKLLEDFKDELVEKIDAVSAEAKARDKATRKHFGFVAAIVVAGILVISLILANLYGIIIGR